MNYGQVPYDLCQLGGVIADVLGVVSEVAELRVEPALTIALQPPGHGVGLVPQAAGGRMNDVHRVSSRHSSRFVINFFPEFSFWSLLTFFRPCVAGGHCVHSILEQFSHKPRGMTG